MAVRNEKHKSTNTVRYAVRDTMSVAFKGTLSTLRQVFYSLGSARLERIRFSWLRSNNLFVFLGIFSTHTKSNSDLFDYRVVRHPRFHCINTLSCETMSIKLKEYMMEI